MQSLNNSDAFVSQTTQHQPTKPQLSMIWVKKIDEKGREFLAAVWTAQD